MIITIDGPAGSGKSTMARLLAQRLQGIYLDSGALYRAVTLFVLREGVAPEDMVGVEQALTGIHLELHNVDGMNTVLLNQEDVSDAIRSSDVDRYVSVIAAYPAVRDFLMRVQHQVAQGARCVIAEGRDVGSVVFPEAEHKFFLCADLKERSLRRQKENMAKGAQQSLSDVRDAMAKRDRLDSQRDLAPLIKPQGAVDIDSTELGIEDVLHKMLRIVLNGGESRI